VLVLVAIETGMRWGELAALRPRHLHLDPPPSVRIEFASLAVVYDGRPALSVAS
jgi:integrase